MADDNLRDIAEMAAIPRVEIDPDTIRAFTVKRRAIGTPYRRRIGTPFIRGSAARRVAINQRSASPLGEPPPSQLRPEGGLGGG